MGLVAALATNLPENCVGVLSPPVPPPTLYGPSSLSRPRPFRVAGANPTLSPSQEEKRELFSVRRRFEQRWRRIRSLPFESCHS